MKSAFPKSVRPLEYVAFFVVVVPTMEGPGYSFFAVDGFSQFGFHLGVEPDASPDSVLRNIHRLLRDPKFVARSHKGFTLVMGANETLSEAIAAILKPVNGRVVFDPEFNAHLSKTLVEDLFKRFPQGKGNSLQQQQALWNIVAEEEVVILLS